MAFPLLGLLAAGGSLGAQAAGGQQAAASTVEGARTQADIEALNRASQTRLFNQELARRKPYTKLGYPGRRQLAKFLSEGAINLKGMPLYNMQRGLGLNALAEQGFSDPNMQSYFLDSLGAAEQDASYSRLGDLLQLAMGQSASAGAGAQNYANKYISSLMRGGNALSGGQMQADNQRQSLYSNIAGSASSIPALAYLYNR